MWDGASASVATVISSYPKLCISISLLVSALFSSGILLVKVETDIRRSFSPDNSDSAIEARRYLEFYNLTVYPSRSFILFQSKNGENILSESSLSEIVSMDNHIMNVLRETDPTDNLPSCHPLCQVNMPFHLFLDELNAERAGENSSLRLFDYPRSTLKGAEIFIGLNIYGVTTTNETIAANHSRIVHANTVILHYFNRFDTPERIRKHKELTLGLFDSSQFDNTSSAITFYIFGEEIANHEMVRGAFEAIRLMSAGFVLLFIFVTIVIVRNTPKTMTVQLVGATIITPIIATIASFGVLCYMGFKVYSIQCVTPFLVLGIGVDDAFILVHWWTHYQSIRDRDIRMKQVLIDVGPSITITSLTNIIAFGVGYFTPTPQMSLFCLCTSIALFFDYIITYSILAPVVYLCASREESEGYVAPEKSLSSTSSVSKSSFIRAYSRCLCSLTGRALSTLFLFGLYAFCAVGVFSVRATFDPSKAFPSDSVLVRAIQKIGPVFNEFFPLSVYVNNAPNISNVEEYREFRRMIDTLEDLPMVYNDNKTVLFLNQYEKFDREVTSFTNLFSFSPSSNYTLSLHNMGMFLDHLNNPPSIKYRKEKNDSGEGVLEGFQMTIIARGMHEWSERANYEHSVRQKLKQFPQFNASIFDADSAVLAVILTTRDDLIGSICLTVACMACVCIFFISNKWGVLIITYTISSICFCLIGLLSWWGVDLDPVMQVDVLLATGFSVDYTAHIAYQYYQAHGTSEERLTRSLSEMAAPMLQAGISTVLCMLPLIFIQTYTIVCFAKTVFIVVGCGIYHGLVVLPVLLSFTASDKEVLISDKNDSINNGHINQPLLVDKKTMEETETNTV